jgi:DNA polymerase-3 subunit delta
MKTKGFQIDNKAVELVAEYLGTDLSKLTNELDKLIVNIGEKKKIGLAEVEKNIGISKDYNVFELQEAIASKNVVKTQRIIENFQGNMKRNPIELVIGSLFSYFQKLYILRQNINSNDKELSRLSGVNPYFLKKTKDEATNISLNGYRNVFKILRDYDGRTKGMNNRSTPKEELLKELVGKLLLVP